jgi:hypothetical protein
MIYNMCCILLFISILINFKKVSFPFDFKKNNFIFLSRYYIVQRVNLIHEKMMITLIEFDEITMQTTIEN